MREIWRWMSTGRSIRDRTEAASRIATFSRAVSRATARSVLDGRPIASMVRPSSDEGARPLVTQRRASCAHTPRRG